MAKKTKKAVAKKAAAKVSKKGAKKMMAGGVAGTNGKKVGGVAPYARPAMTLNATKKVKSGASDNLLK
jgi:hypothetical protein